MSALKQNFFYPIARQYETIYLEFQGMQQFASNPVVTLLNYAILCWYQAARNVLTVVCI